MDLGTSIFILGLIGLIVAVMLGFLLCEKYFKDKAFKRIKEQSSFQESMFSKIIKTMAQDGVDVNRYLRQAKDEAEEELRGGR